MHSFFAKAKLCYLAGAILTAAPALTAYSDDIKPPLARANSAWVYDMLNRPGKARSLEPGHFASELNRYNEGAGAEQKVSTIYSYLGTLEMYCRGAPASCPISKLIFSDINTLPPGQVKRQEQGKANPIASYRSSLNAKGIEPAKLSMVAIIDGVVNADYEGSMQGFNELPKDQAEAFADKVSRKVCQRPEIDGVQFDIEPFDVSGKNGQYYFYKRIAENFARDCVTEKHPNGRYFSVFTAAHQLRPGSASADHLAEIITAHNNAYMVVPLYDLGAAPLGTLNPVENYKTQAIKQASNMRRWAEHYGVPYKLAIPAAASVHEFSGCTGRSCKDGELAPVSQLEYVKASLAAIAHSKAREQPLYLGTALWAWTRGIVHGGSDFSPASPPEEVLSYLQKHL